MIRLKHLSARAASPFLAFASSCVPRQRNRFIFTNDVTCRPCILPLTGKIGHFHAWHMRSMSLSASGGEEEPGSDKPPAANNNGASAVSPIEATLIKAAGVFTQLFPLWCLIAALSGFYHPPLYTWFDTQCISNGLIFIMVREGCDGLRFCNFSVLSLPPSLLHLTAWHGNYPHPRRNHCRLRQAAAAAAARDGAAIQRIAFHRIPDQQELGPGVRPGGWRGSRVMHAWRDCLQHHGVHSQGGYGECLESSLKNHFL